MRGQCRRGRPGDHRCTPEVIWRAALDAVERELFSIDPATNDFSSVPAVERLRGPAFGEDGLEIIWTGHVWLNFPFSNPKPWVARVLDQRAHCHSITVLGPNDHSTRWNDELTRECDAWAAWPRREHFPTPAQPKGSPPAGVSLWYFGRRPGHWLDVMRGYGCIAYRGHG